jgi:Fur family transcriptional regulator, peroxide stress response regulator
MKDFWKMQREKDPRSETVLRQKCLEHNLRVTPQRLGIFNCLQGSRQHPSADAVFRKIRKAFPNISFDTVNRTLLSLARMGILDIVEGYGYPKRFDPNLVRHHHFHCLKCHRILDFEEKTFEGLKPPKSIARRCKVTAYKVVLEGICDQCQKMRDSE